MSKNDLWIIESRNDVGGLDFTAPDPSTYFGNIAISGMTEDDMAKRIFRKSPNAVLSGTCIAIWPKIVNPKWIARIKTW